MCHLVIKSSCKFLPLKSRIVNNKTRNTEAAAFIRLGAGRVLEKNVSYRMSLGSGSVICSGIHCHLLLLPYLHHLADPPQIHTLPDLFFFASESFTFLRPCERNGSIKGYISALSCEKAEELVQLGQNL